MAGPVPPLRVAVKAHGGSARTCTRQICYPLIRRSANMASTSKLTRDDSPIALQAPPSLTSPPSPSTSNTPLSSLSETPTSSDPEPLTADSPSPQLTAAEASNFQRQLNSLRTKFSHHSQHLSREAMERLGLLGLRINEVTGYKEVERLKDEVFLKESQLSSSRQQAKTAKQAYEAAVTLRSTSQTSVNSLLERKHSWTDLDVMNFTNLVRSDHLSTSRVNSTSEELKAAEVAVDKAFSDLMQAILQRYHEEQVWSDKIRSVSTWASLVVLGVNLVVFMGAIAVVEPWKRKKLVLGLEERVAGMMERVEGEVRGLTARIDTLGDGGSTERVPVTPPVVSAPVSAIISPSSPRWTTEITGLPPSFELLSQPSLERDLGAATLVGATSAIVLTGLIRWLVKGS
ncbi:hypothetical protein P7C73_g3170, partial [Tremellales sp. Uapishka_1]